MCDANKRSALCGGSWRASILVLYSNFDDLNITHKWSETQTLSYYLWIACSQMFTFKLTAMQYFESRTCIFQFELTIQKMFCLSLFYHTSCPFCSMFVLSFGQHTHLLFLYQTSVAMNMFCETHCKELWSSRRTGRGGEITRTNRTLWIFMEDIQSWLVGHLCLALTTLSLMSLFNFIQTIQYSYSLTRTRF